ncbi:hypothetical protein LguiA_034136 [Lonicera macranthoides]
MEKNGVMEVDDENSKRRWRLSAKMVREREKELMWRGKFKRENVYFRKIYIYIYIYMHTYIF